MAPLLALIAVILAVVGLIQLLSGNIINGIVLLVAACAIGPGGWWVFR